MRIKLLVAVAAVAVITAFAGISTAATLNSTGLTVTGMKKFGLAGKIRVLIENGDTNSSLVPQRMESFTITSKSAKFNAKGWGQCSLTLPTDGSDVNCPANSKLGDGTFDALIGIPGQPTLDAIISPGKIELFSYKPRSGAQASILAEVTTTQPAEVKVYLLMDFTKSGVFKTHIPDRNELPQKIQDLIEPNLHVVITKVDATIQPRRKGRTPFFTLKPGTVDVRVDINREDVS